MIKLLTAFFLLPLSISGAFAEAANPILDRGDSGVCSQSSFVTAQTPGMAAFYFFVTVDGVARDVSVLKSSGDPASDAAAQKCIETAHYKLTTYYDKPDEEVWAANVTWRPNAPANIAVKKQPADCAGYYPPEAIVAKAEGITKFSFRLTPKGWTDVHLLQSSGNTDLDDGAILCVAKQKFEQEFRYTLFSDTDWEITIAWVLDPAAPNPLPPQTELNFRAVPQTFQMRLSPLAPGKELYMHKAPSCDAFYPEAERKRHVEGTTILGMSMSRDGKAENISVKKSSGSAALDDAAVKCYQTSPPYGISGQHNVFVLWNLHDPLIPAEPFKPCTSFYRVTPDTLKGLPGITMIVFQLMPNGSIGRVAIGGSSGDQYLDDAAMTCVRARRYDTSKWGVPEDGIPETITVDWRKELAASK
jgi:TonB family protein